MNCAVWKGKKVVTYPPNGKFITAAVLVPGPHLLLNRIVALSEVLQELVIGMLHIFTWLVAIHKGQGTQSELQSLCHGPKAEQNVFGLKTFLALQAPKFSGEHSNMFLQHFDGKEKLSSISSSCMLHCPLLRCLKEPAISLPCAMCYAPDSDENACAVSSFWSHYLK